MNGEDWVISVYLHQPPYKEFVEEVIPLCKAVGVVQNHPVFVRTMWRLDDNAFVKLILLREKYNLSFKYSRHKW